MKGRASHVSYLGGQPSNAVILKANVLTIEDILNFNEALIDDSEGLQGHAVLKTRNHECQIPEL